MTDNETKEPNLEETCQDEAKEKDTPNVEAEGKKEDKYEKVSFKDKKKIQNQLKKAEEDKAEAERKLAEANDNFLRYRAEFDNYKKRTQHELDSRYQDAKADTWGRILPVVDDLERALLQEASDDASKAIKEGVELTYKKLKELMKAEGVEEIEAEGAEFNPELHNAIMHEDNEALGENVISQVFLKGYKVGDKVIRHSMVKVAN